MSDDRDAADPPGGDPVGIAAIVLGCLGIVVAGIAMAVLTAVVAGVAGQRARDERRSLDNAYLGLALALIDGVFWLVLHLTTDLDFVIG